MPGTWEKRMDVCVLTVSRRLQREAGGWGIRAGGRDERTNPREGRGSKEKIFKKINPDGCKEEALEVGETHLEFGERQGWMHLKVFRGLAP